MKITRPKNDELSGDDYPEHELPKHKEALLDEDDMYD